MLIIVLTNIIPTTYTQVPPHQQHLTSTTTPTTPIYVFVKHYTGRQEFFGEIQGEIS
jgi:hypothetical protein